MSIFKRHHHQWWLVDHAIYANTARPNSEYTFTLFTYVCRADRSHVKQVRLQGRQSNTAEIILARQRSDQGLEDIPDAFNQAFEEKRP